MKLRSYLMAGLVTLAAAFQSCEKDVTNFDISTTPMLVTTAFISPQDTILAVEVKRTQPAIGLHLKETELRVHNATVTLSNGSKTVLLEYDQEKDKYFAPFASLPIEAGKAYFLKVSTPSGDKAEAECVVPVLTDIRVTELNYDTSRVDYYGNNWLQRLITFKWQDAPGVENYYHLSSYRAYNVLYGYPAVLFTNYESAYTDERKAYMKDTSLDGQIMQSPTFGLPMVSEDQALRPYRVLAVLAVTDKAYYDYHQSMIEQERTGGNPFAEPKRLVGNMRGSLGVFAAYNQIRVSKLIQ